jgi:predicted component of type VI protein secretion system
MPYIEFDGEVRALGPGVLTVGSAPEAGWRIQGRGIDPVHLLLSTQTGGRALLIRGQARATVLVNGVELMESRTLIGFGDRITIGTAELRYRRQTPGAEAPIGYIRDVRRGRVYQLRERSTIGRDQASSIVVPEPDVSRIHAELIQREEAYLLVPQGVSVTSVNGVRLLAPTTLQEGDEIGIGRTLLRFTTTLPEASTISRDPPGRASSGIVREARAQTTFIGAIERQEQQSRITRRRMTRVAAIALVTVAVTAIVVTLYADARGSMAPRRLRHPAPRSSRASQSGDAQSGDTATGASRGESTPAEALLPTPTPP